jgi:hypothetical protein
MLRGGVIAHINTTSSGVLQVSLQRISSSYVGLEFGGSIEDAYTYDQRTECKYCCGGCP